MQELPSGAPATLGEAFGLINATTHPGIDVLKVMVLVEAAGKRLYEDLADQVADPAVKALLCHNGREELAHAHRVARAIGALTGSDYPVPAPDANPYLASPAPARPVTAAMLNQLAAAEFGGEALYEHWAANIGNPEAAALFRQNGIEESEHGARLQQAAALLGA
jgi:hypothetical protein